MKKNMIQRGFLGIPLGIAIGFAITVIISICIGDGSFYPVNPILIEKMGNELRAIVLQTVLWSIVGAGCAMASVIWEIDSWSLTKQSVIFFAVICIIVFPISYFANWMPRSIGGVLSYVGIFTAIFSLNCLIQHYVWKSKIKEINDVVKNNNETY